MNQARPCGLQAAVGAQAGVLAALVVSDPDDVEERASPGAAAELDDSALGPRLFSPTFANQEKPPPSRR